MKNFEKVFQTFEKNYVLVPLEVFGSDPYKTLVSTLLSARTRDETTLKISLKLFEKASDITALNSLSREEIAKLIYPVGFYKTKAAHLKRLARIIVNDFNSCIPDTLEQLVCLPGVGRKTANLVLNRAFAKPAIAVDTHVHRISNLLGWVKTNSPAQTEASLNQTLPKKYWKDINRLFVSMGRQFPSRKRLVQFLQDNELI